MITIDLLPFHKLLQYLTSSYTMHFALCSLDGDRWRDKLFHAGVR